MHDGSLDQRNESKAAKAGRSRWQPTLTHPEVSGVGAQVLALGPVFVSYPPKEEAGAPAVVVGQQRRTQINRQRASIDLIEGGSIVLTK